jgi:hypothetical protein
MAQVEMNPCHKLIFKMLKLSSLKKASDFLDVFH